MTALHKTLPFLLLILCSCEGATYVRHHFENGTGDTLKMVFRGQNSWVDSTVMELPPAGETTLWTLDQRGKCFDCSIYYSPYALMDSLVLVEGQWLQYPEPQHWFSETDEGTNWIEFDHRLRITPNMVVQ
ncbi:MAG: hypothetical protein L7S67_06625 [Flavobacteriales bacterium]|nr:hypothetical protein [Flavobacteriales bacterium]